MPRIALFQMSSSHDLEENLAKSLSAMEAAASEKANLILFPEIHLGPFFPEYEKFDAKRYAMSLDDPAIQRFCNACKKLKIAASPNVYLKQGRQMFDASLMINSNGEILGVSKMVHITQGPHFYEQNYYAPSDEGFCVYDTTAGKVGIVICFDRHYPESIRSCVLKGADIILVPTVNTTDEPLEIFQWEMRVASYQNSVVIAMCNRVGSEGNAVYSGKSIVTDHKGGLLLEATSKENLFFADYDLTSIRKAREENIYLKLLNKEAFQI